MGSKAQCYCCPRAHTQLSISHKWFTLLSTQMQPSYRFEKQSSQALNHDVSWYCIKHEKTMEQIRNAQIIRSPLQFAASGTKFDSCAGTKRRQCAFQSAFPQRIFMLTYLAGHYSYGNWMLSRLVANDERIMTPPEIVFPVVDNSDSEETSRFLPSSIR